VIYEKIFFSNAGGGDAGGVRAAGERGRALQTAGMLCPGGKGKQLLRIPPEGKMRSKRWMIVVGAPGICCFNKIFIVHAEDLYDAQTIAILRFDLAILQKFRGLITPRGIIKFFKNISGGSYEV